VLDFVAISTKTEVPASTPQGNTVDEKNTIHLLILDSQNEK
jgi:hypothetical protein